MGSQILGVVVAAAVVSVRIATRRGQVKPAPTVPYTSNPYYDNVTSRPEPRILAEIKDATNKFDRMPALDIMP